MHPQLPILIDLQTIDLRILEIKDQERKLPALLQASENPLLEARTRSQILTSELESLNKDRRERERDLEAHEAQVGKMRTRLMELKTNKEYQAHLFEIEMSNKKKGSIEEQILTLMERIEQNQAALKESEAKGVEAERGFTEEKSRVGTMAAQLSHGTSMAGPVLRRTICLEFSRYDTGLREACRSVRSGGVAGTKGVGSRCRVERSDCYRQAGDCGRPRLSL